MHAKISHFEQIVYLVNLANASESMTEGWDRYDGSSCIQTGDSCCLGRQSWPIRDNHIPRYEVLLGVFSPRSMFQHV